MWEHKCSDSACGEPSTEAYWCFEYTDSATGREEFDRATWVEVCARHSAGPARIVSILDI